MVGLVESMLDSKPFCPLRKALTTAETFYQIQWNIELGKLSDTQNWFISSLVSFLSCSPSHSHEFILLGLDISFT